MAPELSVIISTLGNYATLERVLDGYSRQDVPAGSFEVLVVTDTADPEPESVDRAIGERPYPVRRITGAEPGLSANRNAGWRAATAPLVLFTDNDTIPVGGLVREHVDWHRTRYPEPEVGVLGLVRWAPELDVTVFMRWLDMGLQFNYANFERVELPWGAFAGANCSLKRAFVERVGDFDQQHFPYGYEDTDWAYRASRLGFRIAYNERAIVDHLRPMTLDFWKRRARRVAAAEHEFTRLHPEMEPWFKRRFSEAASRPRPRGAAAVRLARLVPRATPCLGRLVWDSVDLHYMQELAPHFLAAWDEAAKGGAERRQPDLSEFASDSSVGSPPGGPK